MPFAIGGGLLLGGLVGNVVTQQEQKKDARRNADQADYARGKGKEQQLDYLKSMNAPSLAERNRRRLEALDEESKMVPFSQDPTIQGERAALLGQGAQALSSIQNKQHAYGLKGGFSNVGSQQDVQDRMSVALAQLAQKSRLEKESKRDTAAQLEQQIQDANNEFQNARLRAMQAIEAGDTQLALQNLQQAAAARQAILQGQQQMYSQIMSMGGSMAGRAMGGSGASAGVPSGAPVTANSAGSGYTSYGNIA